MFGLGGMNPAKMKAMMKQMGINQEEIPASRVVIEQEGKRIILENHSVQKITMQGNESWQITGDAKEESVKEGIKDEDVALVAEKTGKGKEEAKKALEESDGDMASAILKLSE